MSAERDTARRVESWLEDGVTVLPDRVLDAVLDQLPATHQRRPAWSQRRFADVRLTQIGIAAAIAVAAMVAFNVVPLPAPGDQATPGTTTSPTPSASSRASPDVGPRGPATYSLEDFPVDITFEVPGGWSWCSMNRVEQYVCETPENGESSSVGFLIVENVVVDPCGDDGALLDPPPGRSVDALVEAITNLPGFEASAVRDVTVDGFNGKEFRVTAPAGAACGLLTWATARRINGVGANEANLIRIIDVDGTRVVITGAYHPDGRRPAQDIAAVEQIMDSVDIAP